MAALDDSITALTAQVAQNTTVEGSAAVLIQGFAAQLAAAIANASANGANSTQLASLTTLQTNIANSDSSLAAAIAANTPPPPPPPTS